MRYAKFLQTAWRWLAATTATIGLAGTPALAEQQTLPRPIAPTLVAADSVLGSESRTALRPALWLVSDADTRIYLFGTIHVLTPGLHWFDGAVAEAFAASDALVTEVSDVGGMSNTGSTNGAPAGVQALLANATLPQGENLRDKLSAEDRTAMEAALTRAKLPVTALDRLKPWYAAVVLSSLPLIKAGYRLDQGVEMQLATRARKAGKPLEALETTSFQLGLFEKLPDDSQIAYLRQVIANLDQVHQQIETVVARWGEGDAEGLAATMNADKTDPALLESLLDRRNRVWAEWVERRLEQPGTVFVAVGAGHLVGPRSVQNELSAKGIAARRVQ